MPKHLVFDAAELARIAVDAKAREQFLTDNYDAITAAFGAAIRSYRLPTQAREDILAESIAKFYEALGTSFDPDKIKGGDLGRWALSIPINKARDYQKSPGNAPKYHPRDDDAPYSLDAERDDAAAARYDARDPAFYDDEGARAAASHRAACNADPLPDLVFMPDFDGEGDDDETGDTRTASNPPPLVDADTPAVALRRLVDTYGGRGNAIERIAELKMQGYDNLEDIADEIGLTYSNTRVKWSRFVKRVHDAGEKLPK